MSEDPQVTDEQVLANPDGYTVEEVLDVLGRSTPEQVLAAQTNEKAGRARRGILDFKIPEPPPPPEQEPIEPVEGTFSRDRILDPVEGPAIIGYVDELGRGAKYPEIVGALDGDAAESFTTDSVRSKITEFLARPFAPDETTQEA